MLCYFRFYISDLINVYALVNQDRYNYNAVPVLCILDAFMLCIFSDGRFTFVDQRPLTYTNWALGSPDSGSSSGSAGGSGSANTNCIGLIASASTWKDRVCSETLPFVCEISPGSNAQSDEF